MEKYFQFKKEEKAVLTIGILMTAVALTAGLLEQKFIKTEVCVPLKEEQQSVNAVAARKKTFIAEQSAKLSRKAETCINTNPDVLKRAKLDLSTVDVTTPGTYQAVASLQKERVSLTVKIMGNAEPVIQAAHADFQFIIESNSIVQGIRDYVGVTAADTSGNDLGALITGWDEELPVEVETVTHQLSIEDAQGQRIKKSVRMQYLLPKEDKKDQY